MASTVTSTTTTTTTGSSTTPYLRPSRPKTPTRPRLRRPSATASTPNLNLAYASQARDAPPVPPLPLPLPRKSSFAALTQSSLASIPDVSETYTYDSVLSERPSSRISMFPTTPGRPTADDVRVGDTVDVPGPMQGVVRFVGSVQGKKGTFAGVELHPDYAARGKNSGDVDG